MCAYSQKTFVSQRLWTTPISCFIGGAFPIILLTYLHIAFPSKRGANIFLEIILLLIAGFLLWIGYVVLTQSIRIVFGTKEVTVHINKKIVVVPYKDLTRVEHIDHGSFLVSSQYTDHVTGLKVFYGTQFVHIPYAYFRNVWSDLVLAFEDRVPKKQPSEESAA